MRDQPTQNGTDRPTRTVNDAVRELLASAERQREKWTAERDRLDMNIRKLGAVIVHLRRASEASEAPAAPAKEKSQGKWHPCRECGRSTPRKAEDGLCSGCAVIRNREAEVQPSEVA